MDPENGDICYNLGMAYNKLGNNELSESYIDRAVKFGNIQAIESRKIKKIQPQDDFEDVEPPVL